MLDPVANSHPGKHPGAQKESAEVVWESFHDDGDDDENDNDNDDEDDPCEGILGMSKQECTHGWMDEHMDGQMDVLFLVYSAYYRESVCRHSDHRVINSCIPNVLLSQSGTYTVSHSHTPTYSCPRNVSPNQRLLLQCY